MMSVRMAAPLMVFVRCCCPTAPPTLAIYVPTFQIKLAQIFASLIDGAQDF